MHIIRTVVSAKAILCNKDDKVLFLKRSATNSSDVDKWELPGGKIEDSDNDIQTGLLREIFEETGIQDIMLADSLLDFENYSADKPGYEGVW